MDYQEEINNIIKNRKYISITPDAVIELEEAGVIKVKQKWISTDVYSIVDYYVIIRKMIVDKSDVDSDNCIIGTDNEVEYLPECDTYYYLEETIINWDETSVKKYQGLKEELEKIKAQKQIKNNGDTELETFLSKKLKEIKK